MNAMKVALRIAGITYCTALAALITSPSVLAQTAYPMLMSLQPVAVQAGTTAEITVSSRYTMFGAYQVLVSGKGVDRKSTRLNSRHCYISEAFFCCQKK